MSREIENVSDQIIGYAEEAADAINYVKNKYGFSDSLACDAVKIGVMAMRNDVLWKRLDDDPFKNVKY